MKILKLALLVALVIGALTTAMFSEENKDADKTALIKGNNEFALDLYAKLKDLKKGNLFFSPYSISAALAMTYAGARGDTAKQMEKVLRFPFGQDKLHTTFNALIEGIQKQKGIELSIANALWGQKGYSFLDEFLNLVKKSYNAGFQQVDFENETEKALVTINKWVEEQTKNKIKDLVSKKEITPLTRLVLTNAIYFKGDWAFRFDKKLTEDGDFKVAAGAVVNTPMMFIKYTCPNSKDSMLKYGRTETLQILELPYDGANVSMIILLPTKEDGLADIEKELNYDNLQKWMDALGGVYQIRVYLPKFKMTVSFSLAPVLREMGMVDAFTGKADFSGMDGSRELFIHFVVHKASVEVNEKGTESAAATAVGMGPSGKPLVFRADHPFIFIIRENTTGSLLFIGRVTNPKEEE
jgi:serpin B